MIELNLQPNEWMMLAAMAGAMYNMLAGYFDKKQQNPDMKFDWTYPGKTMITMLVMGLAFDQIDVVRVSLGGIMFAVLSGMGGNRELSKRISPKNGTDSSQ